MTGLPGSHPLRQGLSKGNVVEVDLKSIAKDTQPIFNLAGRKARENSGNSVWCRLLRPWSLDSLDGGSTDAMKIPPIE